MILSRPSPRLRRRARPSSGSSSPVAGPHWVRTPQERTGITVHVSPAPPTTVYVPVPDPRLPPMRR